MPRKILTGKVRTRLAKRLTHAFITEGESHLFHAIDKVLK